MVGTFEKIIRTKNLSLQRKVFLLLGAHNVYNIIIKIYAMVTYIAKYNFVLYNMLYFIRLDRILRSVGFPSWQVLRGYFIVSSTGSGEWDG